MAPFYFGNQDQYFSIDEEGSYYPRVNFLIPYIIDYFLAPRHSALWRFNPCDIYGCPRRLELPKEKGVEPALVSPVVIYWWKYGKWAAAVVALLVIQGIIAAMRR